MSLLSPPVRAFLDERRYCVFADIAADGLPHLTVLWYELRGDTIVMNTARGRVKDRNLRRDPRASLCIEDGERYVAVTGICELQDDQAQAQADIRRLAIRYEGAERGAQMADGFFRFQERETIVLRIGNVDARGF